MFFKKKFLDGTGVMEKILDLNPRQEWILEKVGKVGGEYGGYYIQMMPPYAPFDGARGQDPNAIWSLQGDSGFYFTSRSWRILYYYKSCYWKNSYKCN